MKQFLIFMFAISYAVSYQDFINAFNRQRINENRLEFCSGIYEYLCTREFHQLEFLESDEFNKMRPIGTGSVEDQFINKIKKIRNQEMKRKNLRQKMFLMKMRKHFLDRHF